jgi:hypothetical protein
MRNKMTDQKKEFEAKFDMLNKKIQTQLVQIAQLSKSKPSKRLAKESIKEREKETSSGTESPTTN